MPESQWPKDTAYSAMVILSFICNASCAYCFQRQPAISQIGPRLNSRPMTNDIMDQVFKFVDYRRQGSVVNLVMLGGEALIFPDHCLRLLRGMPALSNARLTTNGVLLVPSLAERLVEAGLKSALITFDGSQPNHDATRYLAGNRGTYDTIVKNLCAVETTALRTNIRIHVTPHNYASIPDLLNDLSTNLNPSLHTVFFALVHDTGVGWQSGLDPNTLPAEEAIIELYRLSAALDFGVPTRTRVPCPMCQAGGSVIGPTGHLYPCEEMAGFEDRRVGDVWNGYDEAISNIRWGRCFTSRIDPDPDWREPLNRLDEVLADLSTTY